MNNVEKWCKELGEEILRGDYDDGLAYILTAATKRSKELAPALFGPATASLVTSSPILSNGDLVTLNPASPYSQPWKAATLRVVEQRRTRTLVEVVGGGYTAAQRPGRRVLVQSKWLVKLPTPTTAKGTPKKRAAR